MCPLLALSRSYLPLLRVVMAIETAGAELQQVFTLIFSHLQSTENRVGYVSRTTKLHSMNTYSYTTTLIVVVFTSLKILSQNL